MLSYVVSNMPHILYFYVHVIIHYKRHMILLALALVQLQDPSISGLSDIYLGRYLENIYIYIYI
jgi:hypothetical protein